MRLFPLRRHADYNSGMLEIVNGRNPAGEFTHSTRIASCQALLVALVVFAGAGVGALRADDDEIAVGALRLSMPKTYRLLVTIEVGAEQNNAEDIVCTAPLPIEWPEQKVKLLEERKPGGVTTRITRVACKRDK